MLRLCVSAIVGCLLASPPAAAGDPAGLFQAIRNGDLSAVKSHLTKASLEARDRRGATPLMHAAAFGNLQTLRLLLDAGADVNARNDFDATALLWAARDPAKAKLLIERGADVNIQSKQGRTPLMVAALRPGGSATLALLIAKGADIHKKDERRNSTALTLASSVGDIEMVRLLLSKGVNPRETGASGITPLFLAASSRQPEVVRLLIGRGVDVNAANTAFGPPQRNGSIKLNNITPLHNASAFGPVEMISGLLKAGAGINAADGRGLTPLFFALASEYPSPGIVRLLLTQGAEVNARDANGETPLDWAAKFGYPEILNVLKKAGAKHGVPYEAPKQPEAKRPTPKVAIARGIALLETTSATFFTRSGCVGCHHQPMVARAQFAAKAAGMPINESAAKEQLVQMRAQWLALQEEFLQSLNPGGGANRLAENLLGLKAANYAPDIMTDSAIVDIAESQQTDGSWTAGEVQPRPPLVESLFASTSRAIQALQAYSIPARHQEFTERIARAAIWLKLATPVTTEDFTTKLSGLAAARAAYVDRQSAAQALLALQRPDGGWGANPNMTSDAYATSGALVALAESGVIQVNSKPYRRGVDYLLSTQFPDGSWHVRSRAIKFQPYFESGFPFGHDQWLSAAATSWAVQAISLSISMSIEPPQVRAALNRRNSAVYPE